jgi:hypothetical protein
MPRHMNLSARFWRILNISASQTISGDVIIQNIKKAELMIAAGNSIGVIILVVVLI